MVPVRLLITIGLLFAALPLRAMDPRQPDHAFTYNLYPPEGFSVKKGKMALFPDPKVAKNNVLIRDGRFSALAQWYYDLGSDPAAFATWWHGYFTDTANWKPVHTPVWEGNAATNQGHRIIAWLETFKHLVDGSADIDQPVKDALMSEAWKHAAEQTVIATINAAGMLEYGGNRADMACLFHFMRSKWPALGLRIDTLYTVERAQNLIVSLLTLPWVISAEDRWLTPPGPDYLDALGRQHGGTTGDVRLVRDGRIFFPGGMFIGWKDKPALHGTWDGMSIINTLFRYHPDPDPESPRSIFYKWHRLPVDQRRPGEQMIITCSRKLWLDWAEEHKPTWCWVRDGKPVADCTKPSEAPFQPAADGYGDEQLHWSALCWEEMFGSPSRNTNDGVQALLAIAHGRVHRTLTPPTGQQVPGVYDFNQPPPGTRRFDMEKAEE